MSHAIQIDADGQHDLNDVDKLVARSKLYPKALVSGQPIYDESISKGRYYGRFITHFLGLYRNVIVCIKRHYVWLSCISVRCLYNAYK
ncbi:hypothetical protein ACOBV8_19855 (plasmid) [Pseudoalteromonas espejiana]